MLNGEASVTAKEAINTSSDVLILKEDTPVRAEPAPETKIEDTQPIKLTENVEPEQD